jgi:Secretion system C-terminal sorting domain
MKKLLPFKKTTIMKKSSKNHFSVPPSGVRGLIFLFLFFSFFSQAQIVNIPDANFKAKLLAASPNSGIASTQTPVYNVTTDTWSVSTFHKIDTNNDGEIQESEALAIKWLDVKCNNCSSTQKISSLEGVLSFTNLQYLNCRHNQLPSLNLQGLTNLEALICNNNQIQSLNILGLSNLYTLICFTNQLSSLNVQGLTNLHFLDCSYNQLSSLNVQGLTNLHFLDCVQNQLASLNVQGLANLQNLYCSMNQLTSLNVQGLSNLQKLNCSNNLLTNLYIKNDYLNISNYFFENNQNLQYICCSDNQLTQVQQKVAQLGYINCQVNTYCSFTPGGNYNTISGQIKFDFNQNGCDAIDEPYFYKFLNYTNDTNSGFVATNNEGNYNAYVLQGTHTITPQIENPSLFISTPPTANITFPNSNNNTQTQNFCISPNPANLTCSYESVIMPISPVRPGFNVDFKIIYRNLGNVVLNGEVVLPYNSNTMTYISATPAPTTISNGLLKWSFNQMMPLQNRQITLKFNINPPTHPTFPVNGGDLVCFDPYMSITNNCGLVYQPFFDETCFEVVNSYDPNDKTCLQGNTPSPQYIGEYVHYKIRFENTGTYFAQNVVVRDDIDLTKFDINSLVVLDASHNMLVTRISGNKVEFIFENIQLPFPPSEDRHGYILFKIKLKNNLVVGNTFSNRANIYFDYNFPIITNNEVSTLTALGTPAFEFSEFITLFPNPAKDRININTKQGINLKSIEIFNMLGQLVMAIPNKSNERSVDISSLSSGQYMVKVNTDKGISHSKFVKE